MTIRVPQIANGLYICAEFRKGKTKFNKNNLLLVCGQPMKGKVVRTIPFARERPRGRIISRVTVYVLPSDETSEEEHESECFFVFPR